MELPNLIEKIESLRQELSALQPLPAEQQEKLDRKFRLEFNYNSNHIEGNTLTYGETMLYLIFDQVTGEHKGREYEEMRASDVALKLVQEYAADKERPLNETFIKELNKIILVRPYWADAITPDGHHTQREISIGDYKKYPNSVKLQNGEMFHYASPQETPAKMSDLVQWYREEIEKKELHPVEIAALLHYRFVRIHPFDDGNGRISRLLMNYVLYGYGYPPVIIKSANKKDYLRALNKADIGDINAFVEYITEQLIWSLETSVKAAKGENIEESDDVEKEIAIWKKEIKKRKTYGTPKDKKEQINKLFVDSINPVIKIFLEKFDSSFRELFDRWNAYITINGGTPRGVPFINLLKRGLNPFLGIDQIDSIEVSISMQWFKLNRKNHFDADANLIIRFYENDYLITSYLQPFIERVFSYDKIIPEGERQAVINDIVKHIFNYIKENTEK